MNTALTNIKEISTNLIPLLGAIALIAVIILVIELIKAVKSTTKLLDKTKGTVELVDESIEKVQAPLDTVVKVSHTVDLAHDATINGLKEAKNFVAKNAEMLREKISDLASASDKQVEDEDIDANDIL